MYIRCDELCRILAVMALVIPRKGGTLPVTRNILVGDGKMVGTDLTTCVVIDGLDTGEDRFLLPFSTLADLAAHLPSTDVLELRPVKGAVELVAADMTSTLLPFATAKVEEYPPVPAPPQDPQAAVLDGLSFTRAAMATLPYVAKDTARPVLNNVFLRLKDPVEVAAADGFRLARWRLRDAATNGRTLLLQPQTVRCLSSAWMAFTPPVEPGSMSAATLASARRPMVINFGEHHIFMVFGRVTVIQGNIDGTPPNWSLLIPNHTESFKVMAGDLALAVQRVAGIARDGSGITRLEWDGDQLVVSAVSSEVGQTTNKVALLEGATAPGRIALNINYLKEYLRGKQGVITFMFGASSAPALLLTPGAPDFAVMPMYVQWDGQAPAPSSEPATGPGATGPEEIPPESSADEEAAGGPAEGVPQVTDLAPAQAEAKARKRGKKKAA